MNKIVCSGRSHTYNKSEIRYLTNIIKSADPLTNGNELKIFEKKLQKYLKVKNVFATSSAAASLEIISLLLNLKKNDEVIIPAHTYCASAISFARNGAKIVWADIDSQTRVISEKDILKKINKNTKAIVVVHLYGFVFDVKKLKKKIKKNIYIIEDCAQAFGAEVNKKKAGTIGDFSCFSFHAQKNLTTLGEGGAVYVKQTELAKKVPGLRHNGHASYGKRKFFWKPAMGNLIEDLSYAWPFKFTLTEIQSAAGHLMLKRINKLNKDRINRAKKFINSIKFKDDLIFHSNFKNKRHVYHLLVAFCSSVKLRDFLIKELYEKYKIQCVVQYYPLYKYPLFIKKGYKKADCPNTETFFNRMISFPFHHWMSSSDFNKMIKITNHLIAKFKRNNVKKNHYKRIKSDFKKK